MRRVHCGTAPRNAREKVKIKSRNTLLAAVLASFPRGLPTIATRSVARQNHLGVSGSVSGSRFSSGRECAVAAGNTTSVSGAHLRSGPTLTTVAVTAQP